VRLEPWYRATFTTPESWAVQLPGPGGGEGQSFLIAEGRCSGAVSGRLRAANYPRRRSDGVLLPDFRGAIETDDGATLMFSWHGYTRTGSAGVRELVGPAPHEDQRAQRPPPKTPIPKVAPFRDASGHRGGPGEDDSR
jgi:hypothetical protein